MATAGLFGREVQPLGEWLRSYMDPHTKMVI